MPIELKKKTIIVVVVIFLLSIVSTIITKNAIISIDVMISISILSFLYIQYYPIGDIKKEMFINKLAFIVGILHLLVLIVTFPLLYFYS